MMVTDRKYDQLSVFTYEKYHIFFTGVSQDGKSMSFQIDIIKT